MNKTLKIYRRPLQFANAYKRRKTIKKSNSNSNKSIYTDNPICVIHISEEPDNILRKDVLTPSYFINKYCFLRSLKYYVKENSTVP